MKWIGRKKTGAIIAVAALTALATGCADLTPETLGADNCDEIHSASRASRSIESEAQKNPIRFDDRIAGSLICVKGRIRNVKWGRRAGERTWIYINDASTVQDQMECALSREDAAEIKQDMRVTISGTIPTSTELDNVKRTTPLRDCELLASGR